MQIKCEEMIREVDNRIAAIDLNGNHIIKDCKTMLIFLKEKLTELKVFVQSEPFESDTDEIAFSNSTSPGFWDRCFISTIYCVLRANVLRARKSWTIITKSSRKNRNCSLTAMWRFSSITVAEPLIWTTIISCVEDKET